MTPAQLRAFSAVVRRGSVRAAAIELDVTEAAISFHVSQLRKELDDRLFVRVRSGLAFTPGGLRLASRAAEMLGLQDRTVLEVSQAGRGRRMLQIAASSLFAEHAAPGLIELFTGRADDLDVELSVQPPNRYESLLRTRAVDLAIGPEAGPLSADIDAVPFLNYRLTLVDRTRPPAGRRRGHAGPAARADLAAWDRRRSRWTGWWPRPCGGSPFAKTACGSSRARPRPWTRRAGIAASRWPSPSLRPTTCGPAG